MELVVKENSAVLKLATKCIAADSKEIFKLVKSEEYKNIKELTIDFSETEYIDSSTIGVLVAISREYTSRDANMIISNLNDDLDELFSDTGLDLIFNITNSTGSIDEASVDIFEESIEIRLDIAKEEIGEVCIFHLSGVMNNPVGSRYFKQQFLLAMTNFADILLDFDQLTFFDSLSVGVLISMHKLLEKTGGSIKFCRTNFIVEDLFNTLNINNIIPVYNTVEEALESWENDSGNDVENE